MNIDSLCVAGQYSSKFGGLLVAFFFFFAVQIHITLEMRIGIMRFISLEILHKITSHFLSSFYLSGTIFTVQ